MDKNKVLGKINKIKELTTPPTVLQSVLDLINSPDSSAKNYPMSFSKTRSYGSGFADGELIVLCLL
jgi:hypothetical protein